MWRRHIKPRPRFHHHFVPPTAARHAESGLRRPNCIVHAWHSARPSRKWMSLPTATATNLSSCDTPAIVAVSLQGDLSQDHPTPARLRLTQAWNSKGCLLARLPRVKVKSQDGESRSRASIGSEIIRAYYLAQHPPRPWTHTLLQSNHTCFYHQHVDRLTGWQAGRQAGHHLHTASTQQSGDTYTFQAGRLG